MTGVQHWSVTSYWDHRLYSPFETLGSSMGSYEVLGGGGKFRALHSIRQK